MSLPRRTLSPARPHAPARTPHHRPTPRTRHRTTHGLRRPLARHLAGHLAAAVGLAAIVTLVPTSAEATGWPGHPDRSLVRHTVRPGETATGLAVRYHAWTDELIRLNRLGPSGALARGQVISIPVVVSAVRRARGHATHPHKKKAHRTHRHQTHRHRTHRHRTHRHRARPVLIHSITPHTRRWLHADLTRTEVRHLVRRMARHYGVPPKLALAVAWQESGWQQRRVSSAGALGVMQVMPDTGRWMRWYAGRPLRLRDTHDNIRAGVLTLKVLRGWTKRDKNAVAAYYQGLGALRRHGYFEDTKRYVRAVRAHERKLARTGSPI